MLCVCACACVRVCVCVGLSPFPACMRVPGNDMYIQTRNSCAWLHIQFLAPHDLNVHSHACTCILPVC